MFVYILTIKVDYTVLIVAYIAVSPPNQPPTGHANTGIAAFILGFIFFFIFLSL